MAAVARYGNMGTPRGGINWQAQERAGWALSSSAPPHGGHPPPSPALGLTRTPHAGSGNWQPLGSGVGCSFLTCSRAIPGVGRPSSPLPLAVWDWQSGRSQGWKWDMCRSNEAPMGASRLRLGRVEPWHGVPRNAQESSCSRRQVLRGQGGSEGRSWMVWGVFPCAVSVCTQRRAHFMARELID